jgi:hypothetical protein
MHGSLLLHKQLCCGVQMRQLACHSVGLGGCCVSVGYYGYGTIVAALCSGGARLRELGGCMILWVWYLARLSRLLVASTCVCAPASLQGHRQAHASEGCASLHGALSGSLSICVVLCTLTYLPAWPSHSAAAMQCMPPNLGASHHT